MSDAKPPKKRAKLLLKMPPKKDVAKDKAATCAALNAMVVNASIIPQESIKQIADEIFRGRPTKYDPKYCLMIYSFLCQGMSKAAACAMCGITFVTCWSWCKKYPEFFKAIKEGEKMSEAWWTEIGRRNLGNPNFNHILWMMNMSNRFKYKTSNSKEEIKKHVTRKELNVNVSSNNNLEDVARILVEAGAIQPAGNSNAIDATAEQIHDADT